MKRFLLGLFLAFPLLCSAQSNYLKGYILTNTKEKQTGFVDYQGRIVSPSVVRFKKGPEEQVETFTVENCAGYGIEGKESFERFTVNVSQAYTRTSRLEVGLDTTTKRQTVFLKVLQVGKNVSLFSYTDEIKERFFILSKLDKEPYELFRAQYLEKNSSKILGDYTYRAQIVDELSKNEGVGKYDEKKVDVLRYEQMDLLKIVSVINNQKAPKSNTSSTKVYVGTGLSVSLPKYSKNNVLANDDNVFSGSYMPMLAVGFNAPFDPGLERYVMKFELAIFNSKNKIEKNNFSHAFDQTTLSFITQFNYSFYRVGKSQLFAGIGGLASLSTYRNNRAGRTIPAGVGFEGSFEEQKLEFEPFNISAVGRIGAIINKRLEVSAGYIVPAKITGYEGFNISMQRVTLGLNFLLSSR